MNKNNLQTRRAKESGQSSTPVIKATPPSPFFAGVGARFIERLSGKTQKQKQKIGGISESNNRPAIKAAQNYRSIKGSLKKKPATSPGSTKLHRNPRKLLRTALIITAYLFAFIIFDLITHNYEELPGVVSWYPPAGLTYALLLVFGVRFTPVVTIALFIDSVFVYRMPQPIYLLFLWALIISLIYSAATAFLRHVIHFDGQMRKFQDVTWFAITAVLVSALLAVLTVTSSALLGNMTQSEILHAIFDWWIGETVGVLTVAPFLLIYMMPGLKRFMEGQPVRLPARRSFPRPTLAVIGQAFSIAFMLYWVFGTRIPGEYKSLDFIILPLIWIALDKGFKGVTVGIVAINFGIMSALWLFKSDLANLGELQLLMILDCIVGLFMGAVVTERKQADETSQKSAKHFRALVENSLEEISLVNSNGTLTYESPTSHRPLGYPPNSLVGNNIIDLFHPDDRAVAAQLLEQVVKHPGSVKEATFRLRHQDGSWRWMEGFLTNLLDEPAVQSVVINYRDVTEAKKADLVRQVLFEIMQGSVATEDLQGFLTLVHKSIGKVITAENFFVALYNKDTTLFEEIYSVDKYDPPSQPQKLEKSISAYIFRTGQPLLLTQTRFDQLAAQGEVKLVGKNSPSWLGVPLKIANEITGVMVVQDYEKDNRYSERDMEFLVSIAGEVAQVTRRKQQDKAMRENEAFLNNVIENIPNMIFVKDARDLRYVRFNKAGEELLGFSKSDLYGKNDYDFFPKDEAAHFIHKDKEALSNNLSIDIPEEKILTRDKGERILHTKKIPILDELRNPKYLLGISEDITERLQAEKDIVNLAKFPSENPYPVLRIARDDRLIYINQAGLNLLPEWHLQIGQAVPNILREALTQSMNDGKTHSLDLKHGERVYAFFITPIVSAGYTNLYGRDITDLKQAEKEMRGLISDLRNLSEVEKKNRLFAEALAKNIIALKSSLNTDEILDSIISGLSQVIPSDAINIMLIKDHYARIVRAQGYQERGLIDWGKQKKFELDENKIFNEIIRSKKYKITSNTEQSKDWITFAETAWIKSNIIAPILEDNKVIGFVNVDSTTPDFFTEDQARQLMAFTDQVSTALKNAHLYEATQLRVNRMQAMTQIDQAINSGLDLNVSLEIVLGQAMEQLKADAVDILLVNNATSSLVFSKAKGFKTDEIRKSNLSLGAGLSGRAVLERATLAIPDLNLAAQSYFKNLLVEREGFISYYCVPLLTKGQLKGVMEVFFRHAFQADQEWLEFLEMLAQQTAIAINNAELLNSLQKSNVQLLNAYETTLKGWVDALDMRDKETEGHTQRVTELSLKLARLMGLKDKEIVNFQRGALLHDIGKVAVSDTILNKPGPLTDEEWVIMRKHPVSAFQLLSKSDYLKLALDIPYCHHEKWDGSGYPRGLKGEAIPLAARIFAIIDVWDALTSDRPYRKAWTKKKALKHIQEQSGKHFDPEVVNVFLKNPSVQITGD